jgi:hypothetical protein
MISSRVACFSRGVRPAVLAGVLSLVVPGVAWSEGPLEQNPVGEAQVKAAVLFNIAKFVQWPGRTDSPLTIGIVGDDAFADVVATTVKGERINSRELVTRRLATGDDPAGCHVLFVGAIPARDAAEVLHRARGPVLTVGESVRFLRDGGMVRFYVENKKIRFEISQKNAEAAGLKVSSQLLTLAAR